MSSLLRRFPAPSPGAELVTLLIAAWLSFASIPLALGGIGLSWDALNHHVYLGWIADRLRFDRDFLAASYQSFQFPYLYWPFFKLFDSGISGTWAGVALVSLNLLAVPPLWMLARQCVPEASWYGVAMRWLGVALAFLTGVVLSMFDSTANDLLAAIPLVWAVALALEFEDEHRPGWLTQARMIGLSGFCAGAAVAFKLSNGPLAILLPVLWGLRAPALGRRIASITRGCAATLTGFVLVYGYWGWQLWVHYGNPIYPFGDPWFEVLRNWTGWQP